MKKLLLIGLLIFCLFPAGCTNQNQTQPQSPEPVGEPFDFTVYDQTLNQVKQVLTLPADADIPEGLEGIREFGGIYEDEAVKLLCYQYEDLNQDGICELLVGVNLEGTDSYTQNQIYLIYTLADGEPVQIVTGYGRNMYSLLADGHLAYFGSGGAAYSIFGKYSLNEENQLACIDYYFTHEVDGDFANIGVFHNNTGNFDVASSEALTLTLDEFFTLEEELASKTIPLSDYIPLSDFQYVETTEKTENGEM